jgi:hypothetical protein
MTKSTAKAKAVSAVTYRRRLDQAKPTLSSVVIIGRPDPETRDRKFAVRLGQTARGQEEAFGSPKSWEP